MRAGEGREAGPERRRVPRHAVDSLGQICRGLWVSWFLCFVLFSSAVRGGVAHSALYRGSSVAGR